MKFIISLSILLIFSIQTYAQDNNPISNFIKEVESEIKDLKKRTTEIDMFIYEKKAICNGVIDSNVMSFKQKTKYFNGGMKREEIKIDYIKPFKARYLEIIKINDKYFYIRKNTYLNKKEYNVEKLIDEVVYSKKYEDKKDQYKNVYYWDDEE